MGVRIHLVFYAALLIVGNTYCGCNTLGAAVDTLAHPHARVLAGLTANVSTGAEFVAALSNPAVELLRLVAPVITVPAEAWTAIGAELPIVLTRNVSVEGNKSDWPLLRLNYARNMVRLAGSVTWTIRYVFIDGSYGGNLAREQGFDILSPTLPSQPTSAVWIGPAGITFRLCYPNGEATALADRPAGYPGVQSILFKQPQAGCSNGSAVPPLQRCWVKTISIIDMAGAGVRLDASDQLVTTNVVFWMRNVTAVCEGMVDLDCLMQRRIEPLVCYLETVRRREHDARSPLDDYLPELQQQQQLQQQLQRPGASSAPQAAAGGTVEAVPAAGNGAGGGGSGGGGGGRRRGVVIACAVAGSVLAVLLLGVAIAAAVRAKRKRKGNMYGNINGAAAFKATRLRGSSNAVFWSLLPIHWPNGGADDTGTDGSSMNGCSSSRPPATAQRSGANDRRAAALQGGTRTALVAAALAADDDAPVTPETQPRDALELHVRLVDESRVKAYPGGGPATAIVAVEATGAAGRLGGSGGEQHAERGAGGGPMWETYVSAQGSCAAGVEAEHQQQGALEPDGGGASPSAHAAREKAVDSSSTSDDCSSGAFAKGIGSDRSSDGGLVQLLPITRGKGAFGRVVEGLYGGQRVAVKLLASEGPWGGPAEKLAESFAQEVQVLSRCRHPNVVRLLAACVDAPRLCLVLELMETSLERVIYSHGRGEGSAGLPGPSAHVNGLLLPFTKVLHISLCVANALSYLHPTIVHRDLKPANVLINNPDSDRPVVKLTDFGLSRLRVTVVPTENPDAGTPAYMAPECFDLESKRVTHKADVYSLGVMIWEMLAGTTPWAGLNPLAIALMVAYQRASLSLSDLDPERCPPKLSRLLKSCWESDPDRRPAAAEVAKELALMLQQMSRQAQLQQQHKAAELPQHP